jgi:hypothetical protein
VIYFNQTDEEIVLLVALALCQGRARELAAQGHPKGGVMNIEKITKAIEADAGSAPYA